MGHEAAFQKHKVRVLDSAAIAAAGHRNLSMPYLSGRSPPSGDAQAVRYSQAPTDVGNEKKHGNTASHNRNGYRSPQRKDVQNRGMVIAHALPAPLRHSIQCDKSLTFNGYLCTCETVPWTSWVQPRACAHAVQTTPTMRHMTHFSLRQADRPCAERNLCHGKRTKGQKDASCTPHRTIRNNMQHHITPINPGEDDASTSTYARYISVDTCRNAPEKYNQLHTPQRGGKPNTNAHVHTSTAHTHETNMRMIMCVGTNANGT